MAIQKLNQVDSASLSMSAAVYDPTNGGDRRVSLSEILTLFQASLTTQDELETVYLSPLTGATYTFSPDVEGGSMYLRVTPAGTIAALTLNLPASPVDKQEVLVKSTQTITALTINANATNVTTSGAPTTLAANGFFRLRFDGVNNVWDRIG